MVDLGSSASGTSVVAAPRLDRFCCGTALRAWPPSWAAAQLDKDAASAHAHQSCWQHQHGNLRAGEPQARQVSW